MADVKGNVWTFPWILRSPYNRISAFLERDALRFHLSFVYPVSVIHHYGLSVKAEAAITDFQRRNPFHADYPLAIYTRPLVERLEISWLVTDLSNNTRESVAWHSLLFRDKAEIDVSRLVFRGFRRYTHTRTVHRYRLEAAEPIWFHGISCIQFSPLRRELASLNPYRGQADEFLHLQPCGQGKAKKSRGRPDRGNLKSKPLKAFPVEARGYLSVRGGNKIVTLQFPRFRELTRFPWPAERRKISGCLRKYGEFFFFWGGSNDRYAFRDTEKNRARGMRRADELKLVSVSPVFIERTAVSNYFC